EGPVRRTLGGLDRPLEPPVHAPQSRQRPGRLRARADGGDVDVATNRHVDARRVEGAVDAPGGTCAPPLPRDAEAPDVDPRGRDARLGLDTLAFLVDGLH